MDTDISKLTIEEISSELSKLKVPHSSSWEREKLEETLIDARLNALGETDSNQEEIKNLETKHNSKEVVLKGDDENVENDKFMSKSLSYKNAIFSGVFFLIFLILGIVLLLTAPTDMYDVGWYVSHGETNGVSVFFGIIFILLAAYELVSFILSMISYNSTNLNNQNRRSFNIVGIVGAFGISTLINKDKDNKEEQYIKKAIRRIAFFINQNLLLKQIKQNPTFALGFYFKLYLFWKLSNTAFINLYDMSLDPKLLEYLTNSLMTIFFSFSRKSIS